MVSNNSTKMFMNLVNEKHQVVKSRLDELVNTFGDNEQSKKLEINKKLLQTAEELSAVLAVEDRPNWLNEIVNLTSGYAKKNKRPDTIVSGSAGQLMQGIIKYYQPAFSHVWKLEETVDSMAYNFDEVFVSVFESSELPSLFDSMIESLGKILATGEIDSIKARNALNELASTLEENKGGSYFSTMASWEFVKSFSRNYVWELIGTVPGLKEAKKAFEKTMEEMDLEMDNLHKEIAKELQSRYEMKIDSALAYKKNNLLGFNKDDKDSTDV